VNWGTIEGVTRRIVKAPRVPPITGYIQALMLDEILQ